MTARPTFEGTQTQRDGDDSAVDLVEKLLADALAHHASDVHLKPGAAPAIRVDGELRPLHDHGTLTRETVETAFMTLATRSALDPGVLLRQQSNFSSDVDGVGRFRCHAYRFGGRLALALRVIPSPVPDLATLRLPAIIKPLATSDRGLLLVTGAQASGRSSTVAAMLELVNQTVSKNVVTLEAPVETVFEDRKSRFHQRELGIDVATVVDGLDGALREDADLVFVGELGDREEIERALAVAESGRVVISTMHTVGARRTIQAITGMFPQAQRDSIRHRLADGLAGIVSQQLLPMRNSRRRHLVTEVLTRSPHVVDCIREERRMKALGPAMETATSEHGSHTFDQRLATMTREGLFTVDTARAACNDVGNLMRMLNILR